MLNVLLAGGEPDIIKILSGYISNYTRECEIIPITDVSRVLVMAEQYRPALVIADMDVLKSPVDTVEYLGENYSDVKIILYAAIGNSDLLQKCMRHDIFDYMYKPLKQSEFLRCLQRAIDYFKAHERQMAEDAQTVEEYEAARDIHAELFVREVLKENISDTAITDGLKYFRTALEPDYCVFIMELDHYDHRHENMMAAFKAKRLAAELLRGGNYRLCDDGLSGVTVIVSGKHTQANVIEECEKIREQALERLDVRVSIGVGSSYKLPSGIATSYREARAALNYRPALGYNSVIPIRVAEPHNSVGYSYPEDEERIFIDSMVMGAYDDCATSLSSVIGMLNESMPIARITAHILHTINRRAAERGIDIQFDKYFKEQDIQGLFTPADAHEYLKSAARNICSLISAARADADAALAKRAADYLKKHYYEDISPAKLAVTLGTTAEYFERVFEEHENMGIYEFASRMRINEAKSLMPKIMDDEVVAVRVGYDDVRQFRNEFREYEGMGVREFRQTRG